MKYYNFKNSLVVVLADGVAIQCSLERLNIRKKSYFKMYGEMVFLSRRLKNITHEYIPISKHQAALLYAHLKAQTAMYRHANEIFEAFYRKRKISLTDENILSKVYISMTERELDIYPQPENKPFFWRKTLPNEN